jgi:hypothetical protein
MIFFWNNPMYFSFFHFTTKIQNNIRKIFHHERIDRLTEQECLTMKCFYYSSSQRSSKYCVPVGK